MVSQSGLRARLPLSALSLEGARRGPDEEHRGIRGLSPGRIRPFAKSVNRVTNLADLTPPSRLTGEEPKKSRQEAVGILGRLTRPVEAVVGFHKAIAMGPSPCPLPHR